MLEDRYLTDVDLIVINDKLGLAFAGLITKQDRAIAREASDHCLREVVKWLEQTLTQKPILHKDDLKALKKLVENIDISLDK